MRIAFISLMGGAQWGGSEALWHAAASHALQKGDEVFVSVYNWATVHPKIKQLQDAGATLHFRKRYNASAGYIEKLRQFFIQRIPATNKDYQALIDFKPSSVFISQGDSFDLAVHHVGLYKLLVKNHVAYSFICHSHVQYGFIPPSNIYPGAIPIFKNARNIFFVSMRQWKLTERRLIFKLENGRFTWNPLSFKIADAPMSWPTEHTAAMAIVGNLDDMKGHDTLLEVLSASVWKARKWYLNCYGTGGGIDYLKALAVYYGIADKITFHGHIADIREAWKNNHLLLIPSAGEGLPTTLVEAMVCGRPAVVTDVGGNTEIIFEDKSGFVAASPTVNSFANALEKAWENKSRWHQMGIAAFGQITEVIESDPHIEIYKLLKE